MKRNIFVVLSLIFILTACDVEQVPNVNETVKTTVVEQQVVDDIVSSVESESTVNRVEEQFSSETVETVATDDTVKNVETVNTLIALDTITLHNGVEIPWYNDRAYIEVNDNEPYFTEDEIVEYSFEDYAELDELGRCGVTVACIGRDIMPTEEREGIGQVKPTGWQTVKYDCVDGKYLYNRCHLIGFQLAGENANKQNLITGTRYLNVVGMLPFENKVADYVKQTDNHVMYRVTPEFGEDNLVAYGVLIEGYSVEDCGESIFFNVFCYNTQPNIEIDYATGNSWLSGTAYETVEIEDIDDLEIEDVVESIYILNTNTKKFHKVTCSSAKQIKEENMEEYTGNREELIELGYTSCGKCKA